MVSRFRLRSGRRAALLALVIVLGVVPVFWLTALFSRPERRLLEVATRLVPTKTWQGGIGHYPGYEPYFFLSDHEIVRLGGNFNRFQPVRLDLKTGRETALAIHTGSMRATLQTRSFSVSPDRKWLLWINNVHRCTRAPMDEAVVAAALDRSGRRETWPHLGGVGVPFWRKDSRGWASWTLTGASPRPLFRQVRLDDPEPKPTAAPAITSGENIPLLLGYSGVGEHAVCLDQQQMRRIGILERVEQDSTGYLNMALRARTRNPAATFVTMDLSAAPPVALRRFTAPVPLGAARAAVALSPDGRRLAWIVETPTSRLNGLRDALSRRLPALFPPVSRPPSVSLWTSRLDGGDAREIGHTPKLRGHFSGAFTGDSAPSAPQWTPNGRKIGFLHDGFLWIVPAPEK